MALSVGTAWGELALGPVETMGPKGIASGEVEVKRRATGERETLSIDGAVNRLVAGSGS